ncbi:hypothetical protein M1N92_05085, partial [Dehalococcoidia bacterium]|nr:hypothetical protein [Dehalococcoidia bacterium]
MMKRDFGKDYGSLAECQRVARSYEYSSRLETLGFKHHQIAAPLDDRLNGSRARGGKVEQQRKARKR